MMDAREWLLTVGNVSPTRMEPRGWSSSRRISSCCNFNHLRGPFKKQTELHFSTNPKEDQCRQTYQVVVAASLWVRTMYHIRSSKQTVSTKRLLAKQMSIRKHNLNLRRDLMTQLESRQEFGLEKIDRPPSDLFCTEDGVKLGMHWSQVITSDSLLILVNSYAIPEMTSSTNLRDNQ